MARIKRRNSKLLRADVTYANGKKPNLQHKESKHAPDDACWSAAGYQCVGYQCSSKHAHIHQTIHTLVNTQRLDNILMRLVVHRCHW